jgi:phospholipase/carboxylesterase
MTHDIGLVHVVREPTAGTDRDGPRPPLLILLHGVGSNETSMARLAPALDPRFLVLSVRSPLELGPNAYGWFHVTFTPHGPSIVAEEAIAGWQRIASFVDDAVRAYDADPARVYLAGFSQGAIMSLATLLTAPEKIAGVAAMSGRLLPEVLPHAAAPAALAGKPVLILHGTHDEKLGIHFARSARDRLATLPLDLTYRELPIGHLVTPESLAEVSAWLTARLDSQVPADAR